VALKFLFVLEFNLFHTFNKQTANKEKYQDTHKQTHQQDGQVYIFGTNKNEENYYNGTQENPGEVFEQRPSCAEEEVGHYSKLDLVW
jgi:hypothetical protein